MERPRILNRIFELAYASHSHTPKVQTHSYRTMDRDSPCAVEEGSAASAIPAMQAKVHVTTSATGSAMASPSFPAMPSASYAPSLLPLLPSLIRRQREAEYLENTDEPDANGFNALSHSARWPMNPFAPSCHQEKQHEAVRSFQSRLAQVHRNALENHYNCHQATSGKLSLPPHLAENHNRLLEEIAYYPLQAANRQQLPASYHEWTESRVQRANIYSTSGMCQLPMWFKVSIGYILLFIYTVQFSRRLHRCEFRTSPSCVCRFNGRSGVGVCRGRWSFAQRTFDY